MAGEVDLCRNPTTLTLGLTTQWDDDPDGGALQPFGVKLVDGALVVLLSERRRGTRRNLCVARLDPATGAVHSRHMLVSP